MRYFVVYLEGKQPQLLTEALIRAHVEYLTRLSQAGLLVFCGPCSDGTALMILACSDAEGATRLLAADPFADVEYYRTKRIVEILQANEENNFHLQQALDHLAERKG